MLLMDVLAIVFMIYGLIVANLSYSFMFCKQIYIRTCHEVRRMHATLHHAYHNRLKTAGIQARFLSRHWQISLKAGKESVCWLRRTW